MHPENVVSGKGRSRGGFEDVHTILAYFLEAVEVSDVGDVGRNGLSSCNLVNDNLIWS